MLPGMELMSCPLAVPANVMHHVVRVESSYNPYAIGVVGGHLVRQPKNLNEALATVRMLEEKRFNFSIGLAQVNRYNLAKYGLDSYQKAFEACPNLLAGSRILAECHRRSASDWGKAFSCYYSGNFVTGFRHGYVQKIYASIGANATPAQTPSIQVVSKPSWRAVSTVSRYPLYTSDRRISQPANDSAADQRQIAVAPVGPLPTQNALLSANQGAQSLMGEIMPVQPLDEVAIAYPTNVAPQSGTSVRAAAHPIQSSGDGDAAFVF